MTAFVSTIPLKSSKEATSLNIHWRDVTAFSNSNRCHQIKHQTQPSLQTLRARNEVKRTSTATYSFTLKFRFLQRLTGSNFQVTIFKFGSHYFKPCTKLCHDDSICDKLPTCCKTLDSLKLYSERVSSVRVARLVGSETIAATRQSCQFTSHVRWTRQQINHSSCNTKNCRCFSENFYLYHSFACVLWD